MVTITVDSTVNTDHPQEAYRAVDEIFLRSSDCWSAWQSVTYRVNTEPERDTAERF